MLHCNTAGEESGRVWQLLRSWDQQEGSLRLTSLLERYSQCAQGQLLLARLVKDSKLAALELAAKLMYGKSSFPVAKPCPIHTQDLLQRTP